MVLWQLAHECSDFMRDSLGLRLRQKEMKLVLTGQVSSMTQSLRHSSDSKSAPAYACSFLVGHDVANVGAQLGPHSPPRRRRQVPAHRRDFGPRSRLFCLRLVVLVPHPVRCWLVLQLLYGMPSVTAGSTLVSLPSVLCSGTTTMRLLLHA